MSYGQVSQVSILKLIQNIKALTIASSHILNTLSINKMNLNLTQLFVLTYAYTFACVVLCVSVYLLYVGMETTHLFKGHGSNIYFTSYKSGMSRSPTCVSRSRLIRVTSETQ